jgi:hypothetical protein
LRGKELVRKVEYEKILDGKETFKVTVSASGHGGQGSSTPVDQRLSEPSLARPVEVTGQTGVPPGRPRMIKPSRSEIGNCKLNVAKKIRGVVLSQRSLSTCYLISIPSKRPLQVIGR